MALQPEFFPNSQPVLRATQAGDLDEGTCPLSHDFGWNESPADHLVALQVASASDNWTRPRSLDVAGTCLSRPDQSHQTTNRRCLEVDWTFDSLWNASPADYKARQRTDSAPVRRTFFCIWNPAIRNSLPDFGTAPWAVGDSES